jgi:hypothetical protein
VYSALPVGVYPARVPPKAVGIPFVAPEGHGPKKTVFIEVTTFSPEIVAVLFPLAFTER